MLDVFLINLLKYSDAIFVNLTHHGIDLALSEVVHEVHEERKNFFHRRSFPLRFGDSSVEQLLYARTEIFGPHGRIAAGGSVDAFESLPLLRRKRPPKIVVEILPLDPLSHQNQPTGGVNHFLPHDRVHLCTGVLRHRNRIKLNIMPTLLPNYNVCGFSSKDAVVYPTFQGFKLRRKFFIDVCPDIFGVIEILFSVWECNYFVGEGTHILLRAYFAAFPDFGGNHRALFRKGNCFGVARRNLRELSENVGSFEPNRIFRIKRPDHHGRFSVFKILELFGV